ncbi:universal stress protein [Salidesulfovibrio onnuriiensis]|uniref:universal stress protein n=1 Tax=Salidesulfovibrio onnuriiensis TaxID=2583823 RepID=UPI0011C81A6E|nr:universal stress protein [Salidesulfovibrio onnuriiensis]
MFKKIILAATPKTTTQHAADMAFALARRHKAEIIIYHACELPEGDWGGAENLISCEELVRSAENNIQNYFKDKLEGLLYRMYVVCRGTADELANLAIREKADLIVMGPHCQGAQCAGNRMWGMVDTNVDKVSTQATAPVLVVTRPSAMLERDPQRIVMATDFSTPSESALCQAVAQCKAFGAKLSIFHVLDIGLAYPNPKLYQQDMENYIQAAKIKMERKYGHILKGVDHEFEAWEGVPYSEVLKFARWKEADLLVMARHSSIKDSHQALIGSTVVQVALSPGCPTLIINYRAKACT